jgi:hypothetical protein
MVFEWHWKVALEVEVEITAHYRLIAGTVPSGSSPGEWCKTTTAPIVLIG